MSTQAPALGISKTHRWLPLLLILSLLSALLAGCSVDAKQEKKDEAAEGEKKDSLETRLVPVEVTPVERGRIHDYIHLDGAVSTESTMVSSTEAGTSSVVLPSADLRENCNEPA